MQKIMSEHVLGVSDDIDEFVRGFVEKRKESDYLRVGAANVCRFAASDIAEYKTTFKQVMCLCVCVCAPSICAGDNVSIEQKQKI